MSRIEAPIQGQLELEFSHSKLSHYPSFLRAFLKVKKVSALANLEAGLLTAQEASQIQKAADYFIQSNFQVFDIDPWAGGGAILVSSQVNHRLSKQAQVSIDKINLSQSTADTVATAHRLGLFSELSILKAQIEKSTQHLNRLAQELATTPAVSRTCLQEALPTNLGVLFKGAADILSGQNQKIEQLLKTISSVNLGGTVIGDSSGASPNYKSALLKNLKLEFGFEVGLRTDLLAAAQFSVDLLDLHSWLEATALLLLKMNKDFRLMASGPNSGFKEISIPQFMPGSSFFGAKKNNPVMPETVMQACILVCSKAYAARMAADSSELHLNVFEPFMGLLAFDSLSILNQILPKWDRHLLMGIKAHPESAQLPEVT